MRAQDAGRTLRVWLLAAGMLACSHPALAQWSRVTEVPVTRLYTVWAAGDTILAGADTAVFVSTNAGGTWHASAKPIAGITTVQAVWMRNGRIYAGTFGQGVFVSDDLGATWQAFNTGLVGGILDSQLDITDFELRGDELFAATAGAGVYVRSLAPLGPWQTTGTVWEPNQAPNVNDIGLGGARLLALAGSNGMVFHENPGETDWTVSNLDNIGIHAGLQPYTVVFSGSGWVVGSALGMFTSVAGEEPWTRTDVGFGPLDWTALTTQAGRVYAAFDIPAGAIVESSDDDGLTWGDAEGFANVFIKALAVSGGDLYAARGDGLWRKSIAVAAVTPSPATGAPRLELAGPQPFGAEARLRLVLPRAASARIEVYDIAGRRVLEPLRGGWSSGEHAISIDARSLPAGVYTARLVTEGAASSLRLVHTR